MTEEVGSRIIPCAQCGAKNRVPLDKLGTRVKCGKCGTPLPVDEKSAQEAFKFRCMECGARNRIPADRIQSKPVCGKCKRPLATEELFLPQPLIITERDFEPKILKSPLPALMFAWAPWCPTCRTFIPVIDEFARDSQGKIRVGKVNVDQNPELSSRFSIMSVPQILVFDRGELAETLPGSLQKHELMMKMSAYL
jgi:thioredoxin 2